MKLWILVLCAVAAGAAAQSDEGDAPNWDDGWNNDYDDEWFRTQLEKIGIYNDEQKDAPEDTIADVGNLVKYQDEMDKKVEEEINNFQEDGEEDEKIDDYQFEDNRSEQSDKLGDNVIGEPIHDTNDGNSQDGSFSASEDDYDDYALKPEDDFESNLPEDENIVPETLFSKDDDIAPLESPRESDEIKRILEETHAIIKEEEQKAKDFEETVQASDETSKIMEETKAILDSEHLKPNDFASDETVPEIDNISEIVEETKNILGNEMDKPNDFAASEADKENEIADNFDDKNEKDIDDNLSDNIVDKDKDTVDKVYEDLNKDLDNLFETLDKLTKSEDEDEEEPADVDYAVNSDEALDTKSDYENIFDSNLSELFAEHSKVLDIDDLKSMQDESKTDDNEVADEPIKQTSEEEADEVDEKIVEKQLPYIDDALISNDNDEKPVKSVNVDELTNDQLDTLRKDFEIQHSDVFDIELSSDDHVVNEVILEYGETKVISSDNYPAGYPTNRIVDWIVTGRGQGIELNVTDFAVNSALGDYLIVKPGQADDSGTEGLIFSYHLNQPRAYRFMDVDKVFIRFDSKPGFSFLRGFNLTLRMVAPLAGEPEPEPEPEPIMPEPRYSLTVLLGGLTLSEFEQKSEDFRLLVADMATMYIHANGIEPGMNTTAETTQLISASICNVHWPGYEQCAQVKFSVPLVYEDDEEDQHRLNQTDLQTMWNTYVDMDPFAARFRQMGIEEFSVPNDGGVLTVWLVVALGVMVSAAMLAFALWRYSCFEDYSRMPAFSDTDSLQEKRGSALYPTPHQMLPPIYADNDYDSTRVDMGGYANRSYTRDMYDMDSDEDVVVTRDSNAAIQPRDIFSV